MIECVLDIKNQPYKDGIMDAELFVEITKTALLPLIADKFPEHHTVYARR